MGFDLTICQPLLAGREGGGGGDRKSIERPKDANKETNLTIPAGIFCAVL